MFVCLELLLCSVILHLRVSALAEICSDRMCISIMNENFTHDRIGSIALVVLGVKEVLSSEFLML